jgi:hypothetical protein
MDEKSDPEVEHSRAEYGAEKAAGPLRNSSGGLIHKARDVCRDNFLAIFVSAVGIGFLLGYLVSRQQEEAHREQWAENLSRQIKDWLNEQGRRAAAPLKEGLDYARSAAEQASSKGIEYSRHLNPFYHEAKRRFFNIH